MTAEEMKAKCEAIARGTFPPGSAHSYASENAALYRAQERVGKRIADAIAAIPVEPDPCDAEALWLDLLEKSDRTSPAENPDMALITFDELKNYLMSRKHSP